MDSSIECALQGRTAWMRVIGRATYALGPRLADFIDHCVRGVSGRLQIDLEHCVSMDSTFIGVLTKTVMRTDKTSLDIHLVNAPPHIVEQIQGLGLARFFAFESLPVPTAHWQVLPQIDRTDGHPDERLRETMIDAHTALGEADSANVKRFRNVLDALKADD